MSPAATPNAVPIDRYLRLPGSAKEAAFTLNLGLLGASIGIGDKRRIVC
jgi:hypothetical protein